MHKCRITKNLICYKNGWKSYNKNFINSLAPCITFEKKKVTIFENKTDLLKCHMTGKYFTTIMVVCQSQEVRSFESVTQQNIWKFIPRNISYANISGKQINRQKLFKLWCKVVFFKQFL